MTNYAIALCELVTYEPFDYCSIQSTSVSGALRKIRSWVIGRGGRYVLEIYDTETRELFRYTVTPKTIRQLNTYRN